MISLTKPHFDDREITLIKEVLDSGWVTQGPMVQRFEALFAQRQQVEYALANSSCTAALHMATMALGMGPGDEMIVPAFTWVTSAHAAEYVGAKAVFADIDLDTFNLDPAAFEAAITPRTVAVVVVHLFGLAAAMDEILAIANRHGLAVIEDAACAIGATYGEQPVGGLGTVGCFSLHPRKIVTTGEGGMITTNQRALAEKVQSLRNHGATGFLDDSPDKGKPYYMGPFDVLGYNLRLSDIQAAVGVAQMEKLDALLAARQHQAARYNTLLWDVEELAKPFPVGKSHHTYQSYVVRLLEGGPARRNQIMEHLKAQGIQTRPGTHAAHALGYYRQKYGLRPEMFPRSMEAEGTTIALPAFFGMTDTDQEFVAAQLRAALKQRDYEY